ncbi:MAG: T9SS type A sorting domain-containing protein, partial [candidate division WOR-3 bacterium]
AQNGPDLATMQGYSLVIWNCYDYWWGPPTYAPALTTTDQTNIASYISGGGKVWLIGQDIIYSGVGLSWLQTNFNLQSVIEDYNYNIPNANVQGLVELAGMNVTFTSDYTSNPFFCDDLTPNANAHQIILDLGYSAYPSIFNNDHAASFWTIDGRSPNPAATWEQMVVEMLDAFGVFGPAAVIWDFETGLQGWTHTNGYAFPRGWDVEPSGYQPSWTPPDAGDSTLWIDSDAAGFVLTEDTAWSPAVVPPDNMAWLKYGLGYYNLGATDDSLFVGVMTFTGSAWNPPVQLKRYSADYGPDWDSIDVSAYSTADSIRVYFFYSAFYDWWVAVDNVGLHPPPVEDVGVTAIIEPMGTYALNDVVTPQAQVMNFGDFEETFPVTFTMTRSAVMVYADTVMMTLASGAIDTAVFEDYTFTQSGIYDIASYTELAGDQNPANDTAHATVSVFEWVEDFETNGGGYVADPAAGAWQWGVPTSGPGAAHSGTQLWGTVLASVYANYANWRLSSQDDYLASENNPHIFFFHWYDIESYYDGGNVKYSTDNGASWVLLHPVGGYDDIAYSGNSGIPAESCFTGTQATWQLEEVVIPVNMGETFKLRFHFGTDASVYYDGWYVDDLAGLGCNYVGIAEKPGETPLRFGFASMANPTRDHAVISYTISNPGLVSLKVYDRTGRLVETLVNAAQNPGTQKVTWDARNFSNGVYFLRLEAEDQIEVHKLVLIK